MRSIVTGWLIGCLVGSAVVTAVAPSNVTATNAAIAGICSGVLLTIFLAGSSQHDNTTTKQPSSRRTVLRRWRLRP